MKALSIGLALVLGIGCFVAAAWLGNQPRPPVETTKPVAGTPKPAPPVPEGPKIATEGPYPKAVAGETEHDFGTKPHLSKGSHEFIIRNEGEAPLMLVAHKEDRTCQCTGAALDNEEPIPPGGETKIRLEWEIKAENPSFRHSAKIRTNDPEHQVIELVVSGKVEKGIQFSPAGSTWELGDVASNTTLTSRRIMYSVAMDKFDVVEIKCPSPRVTWTCEPLDAAGLAEVLARSGYLLELKVDLSDFSGVFNEPLEVKTKGNVEVKNEEDNLSNVVLHLKARRLGPIELFAKSWDPENNRLLLGEFSAEQGKQAEITVFTRVEEEVNLISAAAEHQGVKVTWEPGEQLQSKANTRRYRLKIQVPPGPSTARQRNQAEKVDLKFDHPKIGTLRILVDYLAI